MHNPKKDAAGMAEKRKRIQDAAFRLFVQAGIESVSLEEVARASGVGIATVYRYFGSKLDLVMAINMEQWKGALDGFVSSGTERRDWTGAQLFAFYLDSFLILYRNHRDLLRFNQFFNIYVQRLNGEDGKVDAYSHMIDGLGETFRKAWMKGGADGTLRTDIPWEYAFSTSLHLMLAALTRYAVGLIYQMPAGSDPKAELRALRDMLMIRYTTPRGRQPNSSEYTDNPHGIGQVI